MTKYIPPFLKIHSFASNRFVLTAIVSKDQQESIQKRMSVACKTDLDDGQILVVCLLSQTELDKVYEIFRPLSKSWRGQFQALAKAVVNAYTDIQGK